MQVNRRQVNRRIVFLIIAIALVVLVIEIAWAYSTLYKSPTSTSLPKTKVEQTTSISLTTPNKSVKVGDTVSVAINLSSPLLTDGTDIVIKYDPKVLDVVPNPNKLPVSVGSVYTQYPSNKLDSTRGIITSSGISTEKAGTLASGIFGIIVFRVKDAGITSVSLNFSPGATDDSNVIETTTGKDILAGVQNLELNITP